MPPMASRTAFEYTVRTRQKTNETYLIRTEKAPGHWIATVILPDGSTWNLNRFDPKSPAIAKQWVGGTEAAAADFASRVLANYFANEGMEIVRRNYLLEPEA
jgi:hypothetical protein